MKHFSRSLIFVKVGSSGIKSVTLEKKGQFCKGFFGIFEILKHLFLSEHFQKSIYIGGVAR